MNQTITRQQCIELLSEKMDEFNTKEDWYNFDIRAFLSQHGACTPDIQLIANHYIQYLSEEIDKHYKNSLPEDLFKIS